MRPHPTVRVFQYLESLDAFLPDPTYHALIIDLGLNEWHPAVWIGRFFTLDNDVGEHWFDNWDARALKADQARALGIEPDDLLIIDPTRLQDGRNGPVHDAHQRQLFWTDVLISLRLSLDVIAAEAHQLNAVNAARSPEDFLADLEARVERWRTRLSDRPHTS